MQCNTMNASKRSKAKATARLNLLTFTAFFLCCNSLAAPHLHHTATRLLYKEDFVEVMVKEFGNTNVNSNNMRRDEHKQNATKRKRAYYSKTILALQEIKFKLKAFVWEIVKNSAT